MHEYGSTTEFDKQFKKLTKKDPNLKDRLLKKIEQIISDPEIGVPKKHDLKHARGSHVDPYVIVYIFKENTVTFIYVDHHNKVYQKAPEILKKCLI
ncbi:MAG: type II toxin-antitoxin system mRNA interferase toxin, RelE/StbE family [Candidatus Bathyarchaeota archaeon]|nr:type II toxin-antitoxin system mRNA interferase toxin, RelE/StbE family [Candidatus Bathyarchaeota archaeon]